MDLSYRFDRDAADRAAVTALPTGLAILMVGVAARQAASPTARVQSGLDHVRPAAGLLAPAHGAFNSAVEAALAGRTALHSPSVDASHRRSLGLAGAASSEPALTSRKEP